MLRRHHAKCRFILNRKNERYHQKLKHSCNFDKKLRSKTNFLSIKLYIRLTHARSHFQSENGSLKMASCLCKPNI